MDILEKFQHQTDGTWQMTMAGCKGYFQVEYGKGAHRNWVVVYHLLPNGQPKHTRVYNGMKICFSINMPSEVTVIISCPEKPASVTYEATLLPGQTQTPEEFEQTVEQLQQTTSQLQQALKDQSDINERQQEQIETNLKDDKKQQDQIDANTALNEAQEKGIGGEAAQDLANSIFG